MKCPYCKQELKWHDWFGTNMKFNGLGDKKGDIYKCENEKCDSQSFNYSFYTRINDDELKEGYPC